MDVNRFSMVGWLSSAARMPLPGATSSRAVASSSLIAITSFLSPAWVAHEPRYSTRSAVAAQLSGQMIGVYLMIVSGAEIQHPIGNNGRRDPERGGLDLRKDRAGRGIER